MSDFDNNPYAASNFDDNSGPQTPVHIPDYLVASILMTLFCCQILGIIAIVFSALASSEKSTGNYNLALNYANKAKTCLIIGLIGGLLAALCMAIFIILSIVYPSMP